MKVNPALQVTFERLVFDMERLSKALEAGDVYGTVMIAARMVRGYRISQVAAHLKVEKKRLYHVEIGRNRPFGLPRHQILAKLYRVPQSLFCEAASLYRPEAEDTSP